MEFLSIREFLNLLKAIEACEISTSREVSGSKSREVPHSNSREAPHLTSRDFPEAQEKFDFQEANLIEQVKTKSEIRVAFLLRHAERREILPSDAEYGALVGLTEKGRASAFQMGKIFPKAGDALYYSSPVFRCRDTASSIALARGDLKFSSPEKIWAEKRLGDFFVKNQAAYERALSEGFYENIAEFIERGSHEAFFPLKEGAFEMLQFISQKSLGRFNFFISHDSWVIPILSHFCQIAFSPSRWLNFLSGIAFVWEARANEKTCHRLIDCFPVTGLSEGFLRFKKRFITQCEEIDQVLP